MNVRLKMVRAVAIAADEPDFRKKAQDLGTLAAQALGADRRAQLTGLESIANSAFKVSDIFDYIKTRTARHEQWRNNHPGLGQQLLTYLERDLDQKRNTICQDLGRSSQEDRQEVYLLLVRAFIQQLVAHYEYMNTGDYSHDA